MTNTEVWDMVKKWKKEAVLQQLIRCESSVVNPELLNGIISGLEKKIPTDRPKVSVKETKDDLYLAFDIFSYLTFCQSEAIGLQIFFENLLRTEDTQSILQGVMNTMKLDYIDQGIERELQYIFAELKTRLDLRLP